MALENGRSSQAFAPATGRDFRLLGLATPRLSGVDAILFAAVMSVGLWALRAAMSPLLHADLPYALALIGIFLIGLRCPWPATLLAAIGSGVAATASFSPLGHRVDGMQAGRGLAVYLLLAGVITFVSDRVATALAVERNKAAHLAMVNREFQHRSKNFSGMAQAIVYQTGRSSGSVAEFKEKVLGRLRALDSAQEILADSSDEIIDLRALIFSVLAPFDPDERIHFPISEKAILVSSGNAVALALLFHELATNATKYGALSVPQGEVSLRWILRRNWLHVQWQEENGPPVKPRTRRGFGSRLFETAVPTQMGLAKVEFQASGVRCDVRLRRFDDTIADAKTPPAFTRLQRRARRAHGRVVRAFMAQVRTACAEPSLRSRR